MSRTRASPRQRELNREGIDASGSSSRVIKPWSSAYWQVRRQVSARSSSCGRYSCAMPCGSHRIAWRWRAPPRRAPRGPAPISRAPAGGSTCWPRREGARSAAISLLGPTENQISQAVADAVFGEDADPAHVGRVPGVLRDLSREIVFAEQQHPVHVAQAQARGSDRILEPRSRADRLLKRLQRGSGPSGPHGRQAAHVARNP